MMRNHRNHPEGNPSEGVGFPNTFITPARNRILSFALAVCLLLTMVLVVPGPVTVRAELPSNGDDAEGKPWDGIDFETLVDTNSGIYYGTYDHAVSFDKGTYGTATKDGTDTPVLWRVIGEEENNTNLTLLSEYVLDSAFINPSVDSNHTYEGSSMMAPSTLCPAVYSRVRNQLMLNRLQLGQGCTTGKQVMN